MNERISNFEKNKQPVIYNFFVNLCGNSVNLCEIAFAQSYTKKTQSYTKKNLIYKFNKTLIHYKRYCYTLNVYK